MVSEVRGPSACHAPGTLAWWKSQTLIGGMYTGLHSYSQDWKARESLMPIAPDDDESMVNLPGPDEAIGFTEHIKPLFRASDREAMKWAFDLATYADVTSNAAAILQRLRAGSMPCDGPWPSARIDVFQRWVDGGMPESAATSSRGAIHQNAGNKSTVAVEEEPIGGRLASLIKLRSDTPGGDRPLVIEHREPLIYMLCAAAELEHALMCEYLFAAFTLKRSTDEELSEDHLGAVERWRQTLLMIAKQEMLHLALNCNLVNALGASPHLSRPNLPQPAKHYPSGVRLTLLPFGEQALRHFLYLERPEGMDFDDADGLAAVEPRSTGDERAGDRSPPSGVRNRWPPLPLDRSGLSPPRRKDG